MRYKKVIDAFQLTEKLHNPSSWPEWLSSRYVDREMGRDMIYPVNEDMDVFGISGQFFYGMRSNPLVSDGDWIVLKGDRLIVVEEDDFDYVVDD